MVGIETIDWEESKKASAESIILRIAEEQTVPYKCTLKT